jgi:hypothetical protein
VKCELILITMAQVVLCVHKFSIVGAPFHCGQYYY